MGDSVPGNLIQNKLQLTNGKEISITIRDERACLPTSSTSNGACAAASPFERCIFRVHDQLRMVNESSYEPKLIAIGPYHRDKKKLEEMEEHKSVYFQSLLKRKNENEDIYYKAIREMEEKAWNSYDEQPQIKKEDFTQMLLLDGCFIVELMLKEINPSHRDANDPIFEMKWKMNSLKCDLILFENQIPFFVLIKLFNMIRETDQTVEGFVELAMNFFGDLLPGSGCFGKIPHNRIYEPIHLLGLIYSNWLPQYALDTGKKGLKWKSIRCASALKKSGVKFEKADEESCLLDIEFRNGAMRIPCLTIKNSTECFLRNLIAYEEYNQNIRHTHIISYIKFLDCLIRSAKDIEILCRYGIIHAVGDGAAVSMLLNPINHAVTDPDFHFLYSGVFNEVNEHYNKRVNRWMAKLRRKHCNSPWAVISILVVFAMLVLALIQSVFNGYGTNK